MKKILSSVLATLALAILPTLPVSAASRTVILKPTAADLAYIKVYLDGSTTPDIEVGGGGTDLNNALVEDGQLALLDPELPGPGNGDPEAASLVALNYEKNIICSAAIIQSTKVNVIWVAGGQSTLNNDLAALIKTTPNSGNPSFSAAISTTNGSVNQINQVFGGLVNSYTLPGGTFSGNAPTTLTHDSSPVQLPATLADLNDPDSRIVIGMGDGFNPEGGGDPVYTTGSVDYAYLEVTYDDSNCLPEGIDPATISPPRTGSILTVSIIVAALAAGIGASLFGIKRTKLKHRASERE